MDKKGLKWIQGPELPLKMRGVASVALPPTSKYVCVLIGGSTEEKTCSSNVYGLNRSLSEWTLLGKTKTGRCGHIALPLS